MADKPLAPAGEFLLYEAQDGSSRVECRFVDETLWLSQSMMCALYDKAKATISEHIKHIFEEGELDPSLVVRKYRTTASDGKTYLVDHYNLDMIIAIGYRVRSTRGTQFRQWATERLKEYLVKGFTMDDERLKNPPVEGSGVPDYFDELLERIRDIRASERRLYLRVREIFALAADYQPSLKETTTFFKRIQNKLHFAATGGTAPELIAQRADYSKPHMGLTSFKGKAPLKADTTIAKNYLAENEIKELNRIVVMWLDYAEDQALRRKQIFLTDWQTKLDDFLAFNERNVLGNAGSISREKANDIAHQHYERYTAKQRALLEAEGETDYQAFLEDLSQQLSSPTTSSTTSAKKKDNPS